MSDDALHVRTYGPTDGRPVLALHGVTGHSARWKVLADALPELRILAVDLRGHGYSSWSPPWGIEQHVTDALAVLDAAQLPRVAVLGHSFGATIGLHLARTAPERVERLALLDPALGLDSHDMFAAAEDARVDETFADVTAARAHRAIRWAGIDDELVEAELTENLVRDGTRWRYRYCPAAIVTAWSEMARPAVTPPPGMPTLLVPALQADFVRPRWVKACRAALGDALTIAEVDSGHMVYLDRVHRRGGRAAAGVPAGAIVDEQTVERVRAVVRAIPAGEVRSYGEVAAEAGLRSARLVGRILAEDGHDLPWHRVLRADGTCAPHIATEQAARLRAEGLLFTDGRLPHR